MDTYQNSINNKALVNLRDFVESAPHTLADSPTVVRQLLANDIRAAVAMIAGTLPGSLRSALLTMCVELTPTDGEVSTAAITNMRLLAAEVIYDLNILIEKHTSTGDPDEVRVQLQAMRTASADFYKAAVHTGVHAFIEFTGLMNEFINICSQTASEGKNFNQANAHCGQTLNMQTYQAQYIAEKMECIFGSTFNAHLDLTVAFLTQMFSKEMLQEVAGAISQRARSTAAVVS